MRPRHDHDCTNCVFLGTFGEHDLYVCVTGEKDKDIVARFGADGDYSSYPVRPGMPLTEPLGAPLYDGDTPNLTACRVAYLIAKDKGLL